MYRVWQYSQFQALTGGPGQYPLWVKGDYSNYFAILLWLLSMPSFSCPFLFHKNTLKFIFLNRQNTDDSKDKKKDMQ